jgi:hypothetical protein
LGKILNMEQEKLLINIHIHAGDLFILASTVRWRHLKNRENFNLIAVAA